MKSHFISILLTLGLAAVAPAVIVDDIGPNTINGTINNGGSDSAGQPIYIAGNSSALYLVSLNAGVWKSINGAPWVQLATSPARAHSIAIDPGNSLHVAIGERDGEAIDIHQNGSGVWETTDGGNTWPTYFDPLSLAGCGSQAIPSLTFSSNRTLFVASPCGIGRKPIGAATFDFSRTPTGVGALRMVVASETKVWARTDTQLLVSTNDGLNWTVVPIPSTVSGFNITFDARGDRFSLAAFDGGAYMVFQPNPDTVGNRNTVLIYNASTGTWLAQVLDSGNGTGCGGRRFVKSFILARPDLPASVGQRLQLFYGGGQDVLQANELNGDGTISSWTRVAITAGACTGVFIDPIHPDIWDFHLAADASKAWVVTDGGVYSKTWPSGGWVTQNQNLFTHYIYTLNTLETEAPLRQRFAYATPDNDAWFYNQANGWTPTGGCLGDANWTAADSANSSFALLVRNPCTAVLTGFGQNLPSGGTIQCGIVLSWSASPSICPQPAPAHVYDGVLYLQFIQTLKNESLAYPLGDAVMLADLPLQYRNTSGQFVNVPGPLGQPNPSGAPVLIRNTQFTASPHANSSQFQTWTIVANDLPMGTRGFWVSGGHANPIFYAYTAGGLFKQNANGSGWSQLNVSGLLTGSTFGPAFVNPYDPNRLYVLTSGGIKVSTDGGASFQSETTLTALLTGSGKFPLTASFNGGNANYVVFGNHGIPMGTLSHMAFDRASPNRMVAASPFTGVFYNSGSGWADLTGFLPKPLAPVSAVGISGPSIYVGTQGRGLMRIFLDDALYCYINAPVLSVPSQYSSVRAAYNAAGNCNIIRMNAGTYHETMPFTLSKHVRLESLGGAAIIRQ